MNKGKSTSRFGRVYQQPLIATVARGTHALTGYLKNDVVNF
jgi:hypothetical protein